MLNRIKIPKFVTVVVLILNACGFIGPSAPEKICNNLVAEDLIDSTECTSDKVDTTFIPHYFHVGETTFDYVSVGMRGFEEIKFYEDYGCEENRHHILVQYLTGTTEYVSLIFCDDILVAIGYHE